jgi:hypothetical protein
MLMIPQDVCYILPQYPTGMIGRDIRRIVERKGPERSGAHNGKTRVQESILPAGSFFF